MQNQKVKNIVELREFPEVIQTDWAIDEQKLSALQESYILTDDLIEKLYYPVLSILDKKDNNKNSSVLVMGPYGSGKSYFLLIIDSLLKQLGKQNQSLWNKFLNYPNIKGYFDSNRDNKVLTVTINMVGKNGINFNELICKYLISEVREIIPNISFSTEFDEAIKAINQFSEHVKKDFIDKLIVYQKTIDKLIVELEDQKNEALQIYYDVSEKVILRSISKNDFNPVELIAYLQPLLKEKGYSKIVFLLDELAQYLYIWSSKTEWAIIVDQIQEFIQFINASQGDISFVGIMHQSLKNLFTSKSNEAIYTKLIGRFDEIYLNRINMIELIQGQFNLLDDIDTNIKFIAAKQIGIIEKLSKMYKIKEPWKCYPLSPQVQYYLPFISRGLAQENRTTFKFIKTKFEQVKEFELLDKNNKLFVINLDDVFDYFLPSMHIIDPNLLAIYNRVSEFCKSELSIRVLKVLLVLNIIGKYYSPSERGENNDKGTVESGATVNRLQELLFIDNKQDIEKACEDLLDSGFIHKSQVNNQLAILPGAGITNEEINKELQEVRSYTDPDKYLFKLISDYIYILDIGRQFNINYIVERKIKGSITEFNDFLQLKSTPIINDYDGQIIFVIPNTSNFNNVENIINVRERVKEISSKNTITALIKEYPIDKEILIIHEAHQLIKGKFAENDHAIQVITRKESEISKLVKAQIQNLCKVSNFEIYYNGNIQSINSLSEIFYKLLRTCYCKFPLYNIPDGETVTQYINGRATTNKLINTIIIPREQTIPIDCTREEHRQMLEFLKPLGLVDVVKENSLYKVSLKIPDEGASCYEAWKIIDSNIINSVSQVYYILQSQPYGIPYYIIELMIAVYVVLGQADIYNTYEGKIESINQKVINDVSTKQSDRFKFYPKERLEEHEYKNLNMLSEKIANLTNLKNPIIYNEITIIEKNTEIQLVEHIRYLREDLINTYKNALLSFGIYKEELNEVYNGLNTIQGKTIYLFCKNLIIELNKTSNVFRNILLNSKELSFDLLINDLHSVTKNIHEFNYYIRLFNSKIFESVTQEKYPELNIQLTQIADIKKACFDDLLLGEYTNSFISRMKVLIKNYIDNYNYEHKQYCSFLRRINKDIEGSYSYNLLRKLRYLLQKESYNTKIEGLINGELKECNDAFSVYVNDIDEHKLNCDNCGYKLGLLDLKQNAKEQFKSIVLTNIDEECYSYLNLIYSNLSSKQENEKIKVINSYIEKVLFATSNRQYTADLSKIINENVQFIRECLKSSTSSEERKVKKVRVNKIVESFQDYCKKELHDDIELEEALFKIVKWVERLKNL